MRLASSCFVFLVMVQCSSLRGSTEGDSSSRVDVASDDGSDSEAPSQDLSTDAAVDSDDSENFDATDGALFFPDRTNSDVDFMRAGQSCFSSEPDAGCECEGARADVPGVCVALRGSGCFFQSCRLETGLYCLVREGRSLYSSAGLGCTSATVCEALRRRQIRPPEFESFVECRYSDDTAYQTGEIGRATCPVGSERILCGTGCLSCQRGDDLCWARSERFPTGYCIDDEGGACRNRSDCAASKPSPEDPFVCILPTNITGGGQLPWGVCTQRSRCRRASLLLPGRFRCDE
jgi:hypothetical protein